MRKTKGMEVRCQRLIKTSDHGLQTRGIRRQLTGEGVKGTGRQVWRLHKGKRDNVGGR